MVKIGRNKAKGKNFAIKEITKSVSKRQMHFVFFLIFSRVYLRLISIDRTISCFDFRTCTTGLMLNLPPVVTVLRSAGNTVVMVVCCVMMVNVRKKLCSSQSFPVEKRKLLISYERDIFCL